jgi:metal-sulfur cluster biosynthetic enzyme
MPTNDEILTALKNVYDPEIGVNIVDLGLVYGVDYDEEKSQVDVDLTLTSPGCPLGPELMRDIRLELVPLPGVKRVNVNLVWSPPWEPSKMSDAAKEELGWDEDVGLTYTYY